MSLMQEYINKRLGTSELETELLQLIGKYNNIRNTYLFVYAAAIGKPIPGVALEQGDFYIIHDFLQKGTQNKKADFYIETPGGSGETAEEIVRFLRNKFDTVSFVVSGEAKSAGTIIVLSGDEILMTETGSLGPIDAQIQIGRSVQSASDYMEWVESKRKEASDNGSLNPFDATMIAQITPGELGSVLNALEYAKDLVVEWLPKYKFKNWVVTETRKETVTDKMKKKRAKEIADTLTNHSKWRSHGRSIKINDLTDEIGLKVTKVDDDPVLSEIVYRIQTICRLLFETTFTFKIFATAEGKMFRQAAPISNLGGPIKSPEQQGADAVQIEQQCPKCGKSHKIFAKFIPNAKIDEDLKKQGFTPFPEDAKIICDCGFEIDLSGIKNQIEIETEKKILIE